MKGAALLRRFRTHLLEDGYVPGDRLRPETELAERFGVSRATIREIIMHLCFSGVLERATSRGTIVREIKPDVLEEDLAFRMSISRYSFDELKETRLCMETAVLPLIARRITPDLQHWHVAGQLEVDRVATAVGMAVASWQQTRVSGFGPFDTRVLFSEDRLQRYHDSYADYFYLNLDRHLALLCDGGFLTRRRANEIADAIRSHEALLRLDEPCLVHKDLAFWNILGGPGKIAAFIDWDDAIAGDPMDNISLMACFHPPEVVDRVLEGYSQVRPLPPQHRPRLYLHLLRNMIVKAVIRVAAGYFDRGPEFFLIGAGSSGEVLKRQTYDEIEFALQGSHQQGEKTTENVP